jgi:hypothetical protein
MKKNIVLFLFFISALCVSAQNRETRKVDNFKKISFRIPATLYIKQGNTNKLELEGDKDILREIETYVEGSKLVIGREDGWKNWFSDRNRGRITVYIIVKELEALQVSGSGDVIGEGRFTTGDLSLKVSGSGALQLEIDATGEVEADVSGSGSIDLKGKSKSFNSDVSGSGRVAIAMNIKNSAEFGISGSGKIMAKGTANTVKTSISGSGKVLAADLETDRCDIRISGSGNMEINVRNELDATISGSGSVAYRGNPSKINSNASGSGKLRKL